jgi:hypothetical protein
VGTFAFAPLSVGLLCVAPLTVAATSECPTEFDQIIEWDDTGTMANNARQMLLSGGIANDPGPNALQKGKQRFIVSGNDQVLIEESEAWLITPDNAAAVAGRPPFASAKRVWKKVHIAAIGDRVYTAIESSDDPPVHKTRPRPARLRIDAAPAGGSGPVDFDLSLASEGTPGFSRGGSRMIAGHRCVDQKFQPVPGGSGPRMDACLLDMPKTCETGRRIRPLFQEVSVRRGAERMIFRVATTTSLRMGSVGQVADRRLLSPPPAVLGSPPRGPVTPSQREPRPGPPGLVCDCRAPQFNCTEAQRRDCARLSPQN